MTLQKATEILTLDVKGDTRIDYTDWQNALKLGIEGLKREKRNREDPKYFILGLLPGETKE